jgi:hypothetical protein
MRRASIALIVLIGTIAAFGAAALEAAAPAGAKKAETKPLPRGVSVENALVAAYPGVPFGAVSCRSLGKRSRPLLFTCTVPVGSATLTVDGSQGATQRQATLAPHEAVIAKTALEQFVAENSSLPATVDCGPDPWRVLAPNATVACTARLSDGTTKQVELTVSDLAGAVSISKVT